MAWWLPLVVTLPFVAALFVSGIWANRRYSEFEHLPGHFNWRGEADAFARRERMVWTLPVTFSIVLVGNAVLDLLVADEYRSGDPLTGIVIAGVALLAAQGLVLWLTERWARSQEH